MPVFDLTPIQYNSKCITFAEWIQLFTLCLAPLLVHIIAGAPPISNISSSRPKWYEQLCHYNPTSILWRYAAITDRRIRALHWDKDASAASNAIFWTAEGWNGSEEMVKVAAPYCLRYPDHAIVPLFSSTALKSLFATLQGASAVYALVALLLGAKNVSFSVDMAVDMIFFPLAVLGLLRLCAALWLVDDFEYAWREGIEASHRPLPLHVTTGKTNTSQDSESPIDLDTLLPRTNTKNRFRSPNSHWASYAFRILYFLVVAGVWGISIAYMIPPYESNTTSFLTGLFYVVFTTISSALYAFYFAKGSTTSTIIPCASRLWYKIYTIAIFVFMLAMIIIAAIETDRGPNGVYTSSPRGPDLDCAARRAWYTLAPERGFSGLASVGNASDAGVGRSNNTMIVKEIEKIGPLDGEIWFYNFTGYCVGKFEEK
ncbi:hypothetical protein BKA63DRAFT_520876 [Paraphoma chrysanthemicola]|nr:hypothetical protein BKA63DRAFT_520876 [Paraphoma chrysanthemicola]